MGIVIKLGLARNDEHLVGLSCTGGHTQPHGEARTTSRKSRPRNYVGGDELTVRR